MHQPNIGTTQPGKKVTWKEEDCRERPIKRLSLDLLFHHFQHLLSKVFYSLRTKGDGRASRLQMNELGAGRGTHSNGCSSSCSYDSFRQQAYYAGLCTVIGLGGADHPVSVLVAMAILGS